MPRNSLTSRAKMIGYTEITHIILSGYRKEGRDYQGPLCRLQDKLVHVTKTYLWVINMSF
jgi:hypothetical protein